MLSLRLLKVTCGCSEGVRRNASCMQHATWFWGRTCRLETFSCRISSLDLVQIVSVSCRSACAALCWAVQEAAYHSVPVISIPLSLGQEEISQFAVDQGRGIVVRKETLMAGHSQPLLDALRDIVTHSRAFSKQVRLMMTSAIRTGCSAAQPIGMGSHEVVFFQQCTASRMFMQRVTIMNTPCATVVADRRRWCPRG